MVNIIERSLNHSPKSSVTSSIIAQMALTASSSQNYRTNHFAIPARPIEATSVSISLDAPMPPMSAVGNPTLSTHASDGGMSWQSGPENKVSSRRSEGGWTMVQQASSGGHPLTPNIALSAWPNRRTVISLACKNPENIAHASLQG